MCVCVCVCVGGGGGVKLRRTNAGTEEKPATEQPPRRLDHRQLSKKPSFVLRSSRKSTIFFLSEWQQQFWTKARDAWHLGPSLGGQTAVKLHDGGPV